MWLLGSSLVLKPHSSLGSFLTQIGSSSELHEDQEPARKRITHGEAIHSPLLGDNIVCEVYLRINCNDIPDNEENRKHISNWIRTLLNLPFQVSGERTSRVYTIEEVLTTQLPVVTEKLL